VHEMYENDSAMYAGSSAWHGLGTVVADAPSPYDALRLAGLDWRVIPSHSIGCNYMRDGVERTTVTTEKVANVREDTGDVLGWVGTNYKRIQNIDVAELAYAVAGNDTKVETAGSLRNGARTYFLLKFNEFSTQHSDDVTNEYLLLANGHDGLMAFNAIPTAIRVVCANTLAIAMAQANAYRIAHKGDMHQKLDDLRQAIASAKQDSRVFEDKVRYLANQGMTRHTLKDYYNLMYNKHFNQVNDDSSDRDWKKKIETMLKWENRFEIEASTAGNNLWNAFNSITYFVEHTMPTRGRTDAQRRENRLHTNMFGTSGSLKTKIFENTLELI
jgi:phage/plasmid-like protein (TIGR03299 family)